MRDSHLPHHKRGLLYTHTLYEDSLDTLCICYLRQTQVTDRGKTRTVGCLGKEHSSTSVEGTVCGGLSSCC